MTVKEMIIKLQSYPQDMIVVTNYGLLMTDNLVVIEEYYNGDSANPHCKILNNVLKIE